MLLCYDAYRVLWQLPAETFSSKAGELDKETTGNEQICIAFMVVLLLFIMFTQNKLHKKKIRIYQMIQSEFLIEKIVSFCQKTPLYVRVKMKPAISDEYHLHY
jgi:hypothetical protein